MITFEEVSKILRYEPESGKLYWLQRPVEFFTSEQFANAWNGRYAEKEAFTPVESNGYKHGAILGRKYLAHRVIWLLVHGEWPDDQIDHINGIRDDNRLENLRAVSNVENSRNRRRSIRNSSGVTGVHWRTRDEKWEAFIDVGGKTIHLGTFDKFEAAVSARKDAESAYGFHPNHGRAA